MEESVMQNGRKEENTETYNYFKESFGMERVNPELFSTCPCIHRRQRF